MVPVQGLSLEHHGGDDRKDDERNDFLNHFKLHQVERAAVAFEAKPVGRYLATVFCESYHPREKDDADKRPMDDTPVCCNFRWPYQASVMKMLLLMSSKMV